MRISRIARHLHWLVVSLAVCVGTADAQVFKPKAQKTAAKTEKAAPKKEKAEPKAAKRDAPVKKRVTTKPKKNAAADRARPDDLTPSPEPKGSDKDYVKIWDDDDVE